MDCVLPTVEQDESSIRHLLYEPLQRWQTRLLRLHPATDPNDILRADLLRAGPADGSYAVLSMDAPLVQYEAISYIWGAKTQDTVSIVCNGLPWSIMSTLGGALRRFRRSDKSRYLWADALCINQTDLEEKSFQVANMFTIFSKATSVLVWLGHEALHTKALMKCLRANGLLDPDYVRHVEDRPDIFDGVSETHPQALYAALFELSCRPWARRVWVQQEIFAARNIEMHCGLETFTYQEYLDLTRRLVEAYDRKAPDLQLTVPHIDVLSRTYQNLQRLQSADEVTMAELRRGRNWYKSTRRRSNHIILASYDEGAIDNTFLRSKYLEASDPRDFVYGLLNLTNCPILEGRDDDWEGDVLGLHIDYSKSLSEVFQDVTRFFMNASKSLRILDVYEPRKTSRLSVDALPSWTIDWRIQEQTGWSSRGFDDEKLWVWLKPKSDGTICTYGHLLAVVQSLHLDIDEDNDSLPDRRVSLNFVAKSHITCGEPCLSPAIITPPLTFTREAGASTSYTVKDLQGRDDPHRYVSYQQLESLLPGDHLIYLEGSKDRLTYLRPMSPGVHETKYRFVCMANFGAHLELILARDMTGQCDYTKKNDVNLIKTSWMSSTTMPQDEIGHDFEQTVQDLCANSPEYRQEFVIC